MENKCAKPEHSFSTEQIVEENDENEVETIERNIKTLLLRVLNEINQKNVQNHARNGKC